MVGQNVREKATNGLSLVGIRRRQRSPPVEEARSYHEDSDNDKTLNTTTWLKYDKVDREYVATLKCSVCFRFNDKLRSARNYNSAFVVVQHRRRAYSASSRSASIRLILRSHLEQLFHSVPFRSITVLQNCSIQHSHLYTLIVPFQSRILKYGRFQKRVST